MAADQRRRRRIAVINQKGGATKTTTSVNLGGALCRRGRRARISDLDPQQGSATLWLPPTMDVGDGLLRVFKDEATLDEVTSRTTVPGLFIVPSYESLRSVEKEREPGSELVLRNALDDSTAPVDYEILDCPHTLDVLAVAGIAAADSLIIPVQASGLDVAGMDELLRLAKKIKKRMNPDMEIAAVVVGRTKGNSGFDARLIETFRTDFPNAVVASVADSVRMREATEKHQTIDQFDPSGRATANFAELAEHLENRWGLAA